MRICRVEPTDIFIKKPPPNCDNFFVRSFFFMNVFGQGKIHKYYCVFVGWFRDQRSTKYKSTFTYEVFV